MEKITSVEQDHNCTVCKLKFTDIVECLRHELIEHVMHNKRAQKSTLRSKIQAVIKSFKEEDKQDLQLRIKDALDNCVAGEELATILGYYQINFDNLKIIYDRICSSLESDLGNIGVFNIYPFGSIASGLALRDCDVDLYIECKALAGANPSPNWHIREHRVFNSITQSLFKSTNFSNIIPIRTARVPIIKCKHEATGFSLDINVSCPTSVNNTNFIRDFLRRVPALQNVFLFLKVWAKQYQIIGRGNMTSYCLITMILFYLQQPLQDDESAIMPAIKDLQKDIPPIFVMGINYAYNLNILNAMAEAPALQLEPLHVIKGFFKFYAQFEFENQILAPFLAKSISAKDFETGNIEYTEYEDQLKLIATFRGSNPDTLQVNRSICLQDPFCLNHNVAKSMNFSNLEYLRHCLRFAHNFCVDTSITTDAAIYDTLLHGFIKYMENCDITNKIPKETKRTSVISSSNNKNELISVILPGRSELRALKAQLNDLPIDELYTAWIKHYTEAISAIATDIFGLDLQPMSPTEHEKQQKLDNEDTSSTWIIRGSVDLWTDRQHQRSGNNFWKYQTSQTVVFQADRRQNDAYAVQLNGVMSISAVNDKKALKLVVVPNHTKVLCKKDPLRKFFTMFRCTLENFNLKEFLEMKFSSDAKPK